MTDMKIENPISSVVFEILSSRQKKIFVLLILIVSDNQPLYVSFFSTFKNHKIPYKKEEGVLFECTTCTIQDSAFGFACSEFLFLISNVE